MPAAPLPAVLMVTGPLIVPEPLSIGVPLAVDPPTVRRLRRPASRSTAQRAGVDLRRAGVRVGAAKRQCA